MKLYKIGEVAEMKNLSYDRARSLMRSEIEKGNWSRTKINGTVLANDDDPFYVQTFTTRDELEKFISELRQAADEAWGEK